MEDTWSHIVLIRIYRLRSDSEVSTAYPTNIRVATPARLASVAMVLFMITPSFNDSMSLADKERPKNVEKMEPTDPSHADPLASSPRP